MKIPRIVDAMNYIDDDLVSWADEYTPTKHKIVFWRYFGIAACLCLIVLGVFKVSIDSNPQPNSPVMEYEIFAEVVEVLDNGQYKVIVTGEDQNFINGSTVVLVPGFSYVTDNLEESYLKIGDRISVTYTDFDNTAYEITPAQIGSVPNSV